MLQQQQSDSQGAAQVEAALHILHHGDARVPHADRYLSDVRVSPSAWGIAHALIHAPDTTPPALLFAANTVLARMRADWLAFPDHNHRLAVFNLALDGITRPQHPTIAVSTSSPTSPLNSSPISSPNAPVKRIDTTQISTPASLSPIHAFGKACGFALSAAPTAEMRNAMWATLLSRLQSDPTRKCHVLAAVGSELDLSSRRNHSFYTVATTFCTTNAHLVLQDALAILNALDLSHTPTDDASLATVRAAVSCITAWHPFAEKNLLTHALLRALPIPQLCADVAETLSEIIGYSGTSAQLLHSLCQALSQMHVAMQGAQPHFHDIHHAIAEIACAISDGNADELMESESHHSKMAVVAITELLWLCLRASDERSFFAAVDGWSNWISADSLVDTQRRVLRHDQLAAIVNLVVTRLAASDAVNALAAYTANPTSPAVAIAAGMASHRENYTGASGDDDEGHEYASEVAKAHELFLSACASMGVGRYVECLAPIIAPGNNASGRLLATALTALIVAGDAAESEFEDAVVSKTVLRTLSDVIRLAEDDRLSKKMDPREGVVVRRLAMEVVRANAYVLAVRSNDHDFHRVVRCVVCGMRDSAVCGAAGQILVEVGGFGAERLRPFVREVVTVGVTAIGEMGTAEAALYTQGLARAAAGLEEYGQRIRAMSLIMEQSCQWVRHAEERSDLVSDEEAVVRHSTLICKGLHEMNDNAVRVCVFEGLRHSVAKIAHVFSGNGVVARAVCKLLETCVMPTLMDEGEEENGGSDVGEIGTQHVENSNGGSAFGKGEVLGKEGYQSEEERRVELAIWCAGLATECFQQSGGSGEGCWLEAVLGIAPHVIGGFDGGVGEAVRVRAVECVTVALRTAVEVVTGVCGDRFERVGEMAACMFKLAAKVVGHGGACAGVMVAGGVMGAVGRAGVAAMRCGRGGVVRECLEFWKVVFRRETAEGVWRGLLAQVGGPGAVVGGVLHAAQVGRLAVVAADVVFAMGGVVAMATADDGQDLGKDREEGNDLACKGGKGGGDWHVGNGGGERIVEDGGWASGGRRRTGEVVRVWVTEAFGREDVPRIGLDKAVKERLLGGCVAATASKRDFRRALDDVARVCSMAMR